MSCIVAGLLALAQDLPWRDFELRLGGFAATMDSGLALKSEAGLGAIVDVEDVLDLDESVRSGRAGFSWAPGDRHRVHFDVFDLSRDAGTRLGQDLQVGEDVYPLGTDVDTRFDLRFYTLKYGYSILQDERVDLALTLGVHGMRTRMRLEAADLGLQKSEAYFLPVPMPGLRADIVLTPSLWLRQEVEVLWFSADRYRALLLDSSIALELVLFDPVALGVGYNSLRFKLDMEEDEFPAADFVGEVEFSYGGLLVYLTLFF